MQARRKSIKFQASRNIMLRANRNPYFRTIFLQDRENASLKIMLTYHEWCKLLQIMDFFNTVIFHYENTVDNVKNYYIDYLRKCVDGKKCLLPAQENFEPRKINDQPFKIIL